MNWLVRALGFPATLIHGDTLVWDRWRWLKPRLKEYHGNLLDVGCGSGAFTIGAARMGYDALGLSWDKRNQTVAAQRAAIAKAQGAHFDVCDVRHLGERADLLSAIGMFRQSDKAVPAIVNFCYVRYGTDGVLKYLLRFRQCIRFPRRLLRERYYGAFPAAGVQVHNLQQAHCA